MQLFVWLLKHWGNFISFSVAHKHFGLAGVSEGLREGPVAQPSHLPKCYRECRFNGPVHLVPLDYTRCDNDYIRIGRMKHMPVVEICALFIWLMNSRTQLITCSKMVIQ